jgi:uncharacterized BrkB/YihY/UPF0761 family membrane protein
VDLMEWNSVRSTVRRRGAARFAADVVTRFRDADGTSHTRALAYQSAIVLISSFIGLVGLASVVGAETLRDIVVRLGRDLAPGPSSKLIEEAAKQGSSGATAAMLFGLGAALVAGTLAMAQIERSANRLFGSSEDRPGFERYVVAFLLTVSGGILLALGALVMGGGRAVADATGWGWLWTIGRWPLGVAMATVGVFVLFRTAPRVRAASDAELTSGVVVAVALWMLFAILLGIYFSTGGASSTYGPLVAVIALLVWSVCSSAALHLGLAVTAELAGTAGPGALVRVPDSPESLITGDRGR